KPGMTSRAELHAPASYHSTVRSGCLTEASEHAPTLPFRGASVPNPRSILRSLARITVVLGGVVAAGLGAPNSISTAWQQLAGGRRLPLVLAAGCAPLVPVSPWPRGAACSLRTARRSTFARRGGVTAPDRSRTRSCPAGWATRFASSSSRAGFATRGLV